jgi:dTMP kinase
MDKAANSADVRRVMARGQLITFEGGEGTGKSTQAMRLADRLTRAGRDVVRTREPGGSAGAEAIRRLIVRGEVDRWSPVSEVLLLYAARSDHVERVIVPALGRGAIVVCDRFADSTRAYQGAASLGPLELIMTLEKFVLRDVKPDLTFVLDAPVETGLARAAARRGGETRFEAKGAAFHKRLRRGFLAIAAAEPERCIVIDATPPPAEVEATVWRVAEARVAAR